MIRTVHLTPPPGDWIAYQLDEQTPDGGWNTIAARPNPPAGGFSTSAAFSDDTTTFRTVWVGEGGSKNMRIGPALPLEDAKAERLVGGLRVS